MTPDPAKRRAAVLAEIKYQLEELHRLATNADQDMLAYLLDLALAECEEDLKHLPKHD